MSKNEIPEEVREQVKALDWTRRQFLQRAAAVAGLSALGPVLAACGGGETPPTPAGSDGAAAATVTTGPAAPTATAASASGAQQGGTLVMAAESMGETLEPGLFNGFGSTNVQDNIGATLTLPHPTDWTGPAQPGLAESWEISDDGTVYTFKIREGVKFHDGTDVNADAIVRSLTRQTNPDDPSYVEGLYMQAEYGWNNWEDITAEDEFTVKLTLTAPDAPQLHRLFHPAAIILSPAALDEFGSDIGTNIVSAGPFTLADFVPGQEATLEAFDDYYGGRPNLDQVVMRAFPDEGAMLASIESQEVQLAPYPPSSAIPRLQESDQYKVEVGPPLIDLFLACCALNPPMDNQDIRLAINYAVSRENLIVAALNGLGETPATLIGPTELGFDPSGREISQQNLDMARQHIEASGLETPIEIEFSYENTRFWPQMAELVKSDLEEVGFSVTLDRLDTGSYWGKVLGGEAQLSMNQRSLWVPDPDNKVVLLYSGQSMAQMETGVTEFPISETFDELIVSGRTETDPDARVEIYKELQAEILGWMPYVMLAYYTKPVVMAQNVMGLPIAGASTERVFLHQVWLA